MKRLLSVLVGLILLAGAPAHAWVDHSYRVAAIKTATAPPLDASLTDPIWQTALKLDGFYDYTNKGPARLQTTAYVLYDAKNMYVGVKVQQAGVAITASQNVDHAGVATDDHISVNLDTAGNGSRVYNVIDSRQSYLQDVVVAGLRVVLDPVVDRGASDE